MASWINHLLYFSISQVKSHLFIALFTIQIVSKQLHSDNMKVAQHRSKARRSVCIKM